MSLAPRAAAALGCCLALSACSGADEGPGASADPGENVLVIDDAFDLTVPVFRGKVAAAYTIACGAGPAQAVSLEEGGADAGAPADAGPLADAGPPGLDEDKARLIAALARRDESCRLRPGIGDKPEPLPAVAGLKKRWNEALRRGQDPWAGFSPAERGWLREAFETLATVRFHGTATAGLVAYENTRARLVLVEMPLSSLEEIRRDFRCLEQAELDRAVALWTDPDVRAAWAASPSSQLDDELDQLVTRYRVGVVNMSYGGLARATLETFQRERGCPAVDLRPYYAVFAELGRLQRERLRRPPTLDLQAAGNEAAALHGPEDGACADERQPHLLVGSLRRSGERSRFSNFGRCVRVYAPGEDVLAPIVGGWLFPLSGTSFAAPLVVRSVSLDHSVPFTPAAARDALLAARDAAGHLPLDRFPRELLWERPTPMAAALRLEAPGVEALALRRLLRPLAIVRRPGAGLR